MSLQYHRGLERKVKSEGNSTTVTNNVQPTEVVSGLTGGHFTLPPSPVNALTLTGRLLL